MQKTNSSIKYSEDLWTSEHEWEQWDRVYNAITVRWPSISLGEAKTINRNVAELVNFVAERVDTNIAEIESVVGEFAPEMHSPLNVALRTTLPMMLLGFGIGYLASAFCLRSKSCNAGIARRMPHHYFN